MNRKPLTVLFSALGALAIIVVIGLAVLPGETRTAFLFEFYHRTRLMMGFDPPTYTDGEEGLRSEHPEEYGGAGDEEQGASDSADPEPSAYEASGDEALGDEALGDEVSEDEVTVDDVTTEEPVSPE